MNKNGVNILIRRVSSPDSGAIAIKNILPSLKVLCEGWFIGCFEEWYYFKFYVKKTQLKAMHSCSEHYVHLFKCALINNE